jgi:hypothetical protein
MEPDTGIIGPIQTGGDGASLPSPLSSQVREFIRASKAVSTLRGYESDWRDFCAWCEVRNLPHCPLARLVLLC